MNYYKNYYSALKVDLDQVESFFQIKQFIKSNQKKENVSLIDVGCGIGYLTNYLKIGDTYGVDINKDALYLLQMTLFPMLILKMLISLNIRSILAIKNLILLSATIS